MKPFINFLDVVGLKNDILRIIVDKKFQNFKIFD